MKISLIIPVYNAEKYLSQCLVSCLNQEPFKIGIDYEIICVNDGSKDNSINILESYRSKVGKGIRIIEQMNSGVSVARNSGLSHALGRYVWFIDSDDMIQPCCLSMIYEELEKTMADGCTLKTVTVGQDFQLQSETKTHRIVFNKSIAHMQNAVSIIGRRSYINSHNIRFKEGMTYGEDTLFMYYMRLYAHEFINTPNTLYYYRQVPTSAMHQKGSDSIEKALNSSLMMLSEYKNILDNWNSIEYTGDAMTEERYYWTIQNLLFILLRIDKKRRNQIFINLINDGHYPYPFQIKRLLIDSTSIKGFLLNSLCLLFPIKVYYKIICLLLGR